MLNDGTGFKRIYLATGYTDLRRGMKAWLQSSAFNSNWIRMTEIRSFCSVAGAVTGSKPSCGKVMVFS